MPNVKHEVARAVYSLFRELTVFSERRRLAECAGPPADEFNTLLARARYSFPASRRIERLQRMSPDAPFAMLLTRLSLLKGAIDTELIRAGEAAVVGVRYALWRHPSRGVYAVELLYGELRRCCIVPVMDVDPEVLPFLPYDTGYEARWVQEHRHQFTTVA